MIYVVAMILIWIFQGFWNEYQEWMLYFGVALLILAIDVWASRKE